MNYRREQGFSLIELTIFLTVLAMLATAALTWLAPSGVEEAKKLEITKQKMDVIERALRAFRVNQGRLPCAALHSLSSNDPEAGQENCTGLNSMTYGVVPVRTLGIDLTNMVDGWGRRFTYQVDNAICDVGSMAPLSAPLNCTSYTYESNTPNTLTVYTIDPDNPADPDPANGVALSQNVAYVLVSHGPNGDGAWLPSGQQRNVATATAKELENIARPTASPSIIAADGDFWDEPYNSTFDDILRYVTKEQLEYLTMDYDRRTLTETECTAISTALGNIDGSTIRDKMDAEDLSGLEDASNEMQRVLWYMQEVCMQWYPAAAAYSGGPVCPGGRTYNAVDNRCDCNGGTWDGATCS